MHLLFKQVLVLLCVLTSVEFTFDNDLGKAKALFERQELGRFGNISLKSVILFKYGLCYLMIFFILSSIV